MKLSITNKLSIAAALLVISSASIVGGLFYSKSTEILVTNAVEDIAAEIHDATSRLQERVNAQRHDTVFLSTMPPIQGLLRATNESNYDELDNSTARQWEQRLQSIFSSMIENKSNYSQIRLIDKNGQELVVVNSGKDKPVILENTQLQNKSHRAYVSNTITLPQGSVYLSEINLNREHGEISKPIREVLRSATPVYDAQLDKVTGMVIITAEIGQIFHELQYKVTTESGQIYITNDHGGYLLHPDANKEFGFDLGKRYRIQEDIPQLATFYLPDNVDTQTILLPADTDGQRVVNFTKIAFDPDRPKRFIAVGITELYTNIVAEQTGVLNNILLVSILMVFGVTLLSTIFSYRITRPINQITQVIDDYTHQRSSTTNMPTKLNDEIGILARSYLTMIEQVNEAQTELEMVNQKLEYRVNERTRNLEASEKRQRSILETMADGLITINEKGLIASFNPAAEMIFGYQKEEVIGKNIKILMPLLYASKHDNHLKDYKNSSQQTSITSNRELTGLHKDGTTFPMEFSLGETIIDDQTLFTGVVRNISERKQIEKMKNEFVSTVSHELRTPLTVIRGSLGLVNSGVLDDNPDKINELLKIAGSNTERLLMLINDILDIQKIESGQMDFNFQDCNLKSFLEQAVRDNNSYGAQYNIKFILDSDIPEISLFADHDRLMQVMANLLSNAAKFSPTGKNVEISAVEYNEKFVRISITDHGPGIPETFQPKLFDKFTQSDSSDTRQKGGTGLGLSICKIIVENHGGKIDFISQDGKGTTFFFDVPKEKTNTQQKSNIAI